MAFDIGGVVDSFLGGLLLPGIDRRQQFIQVLEEWWSTPAMPFLWVVVFDFPNLLSDSSMASWGEDIGLGNWGVDKAIQTLHFKYEHARNISGCVFAQSINFPGENLSTDHVGVFNRGYTFTPVMQHRQAQRNLEINLLETQLSYADTIIRPWSILASHYGLVARPDGETIKSNIMAYELAKTGDPSADVIRRKTWFFKDCFPQRVDESTRKYNSDQGFILRETQWQFARYQAVASFPAPRAPSLFGITL